MSFCVFTSKLCEQDLTEERLKDVWNQCNLKNKSDHIDKLLKALYKKVKGGVTIPVEEVTLLCEKYKNIMIKNSIPPSKPLVEEEDGHLVNPATSIVFEKDGDDLVAVGIYTMTKVYPLQLKHLSVCVSNGWYFKTDNPDISCPFRKI